MPVRHCVFLVDLAEMEKAFQLPLSIYVDEFLERPTPGDRLREYAELAFADEQQIQTLRKADRETMVMARRIMATGDGPRKELPAHMNDVTGEYVKTRTTSQFKWFLHAFSASGRAWIKESVCSTGREWVEECLNLLFVQRGFSSTPEEAEEYRLTREGLQADGPFPDQRVRPRSRGCHPRQRRGLPLAGPRRRRGQLPPRPGVQRSHHCPLPGGHRLLPPSFKDANRPDNPRSQELARQNSGKFRASLQSPFARPAVLAFIGSYVAPAGSPYFAPMFRTASCAARRTSGSGSWSAALSAGTPPAARAPRPPSARAARTRTRRSGFLRDSTSTPSPPLRASRPKS